MQSLQTKSKIWVDNAAVVEDTVFIGSNNRTTSTLSDQSSSAFTLGNPASE